MPSVNYTADNSTNFSNPERGFAKQASGPLSAAAMMTSAQVSNLRTSATAQTVWWTLVYLNSFASTSINNTVLNNLSATFANLRTGGGKAWLRFSYNQTGSGTLDAQLTQLKSHIDQLKPYLSANADVIAVMDAGFIGSFGEWARSDNYGDESSLTSQNWTDRQTVIEYLLDALPPTRSVMIRVPGYKQTPYGFTPLSAGTAFTNTYAARIGHHNDAFLSTDNSGTEQGTYGLLQSVANDRSYVAQETKYVPRGGESDNYNAAALTKTGCTNAQSNLNAEHWSVIGDDYQPSVLDQWSSEGCMSNIRLNLGYRLQLVSSTYASTATVGAAYSVNFVVNNVGYAAPFNRRTAYLVFNDGLNSYGVALASDPRTWLPGNTTVSESVTIPSAMAASSYSTYLWMPDPYSSLSNRPEYSIRLANTGVWDSVTGLNALSQTVAVVASVSVPAPAGTSFWLGRGFRRFFG